MTDHHAFIAAIIAKPDDDLPREIYADYLDDRGESERAEFIRVQCELARLGPPNIVVTEPCVCQQTYGPNYYTLTGGECLGNGGRLAIEAKIGDRIDVMKPRGRRGPMFGLRFAKLDSHGEMVVVNDDNSKPWGGEAIRRRERELWRTNCLQWSESDFGPKPQLNALHAVDCRAQVPFGEDGDDWIECFWRRGFVEEIACSWSDWRTNADSIRAATPLRKVRLTTWPIVWHQSDTNEDILAILADDYPGIEFELPAIQDIRADVNSLARRVLQDA